MNEEHATVEDITDGEPPRELVRIENPRRYIPYMPVVVPVVYAVGNQAGVPVQEIKMLYRLGNNPREFLHALRPTPENIGRFVVNAGINEAIGFVAQATGIPLLPAHIALNFLWAYDGDLFRPAQQVMRQVNNNIAFLTDTTRESIRQLTAPPAVDMDEAEALRPLFHRKPSTSTSIFGRCCASFWSGNEQQPENVVQHNNAQANSADADVVLVLEPVSNLRHRRPGLRQSDSGE
ncbi:MAG TPA: hypothetical protein VGV92_08335 [Gammaproteobacteria bacterium]|nr:hypothetical protein [Gammaproteobacteria bacterium]